MGLAASAESAERGQREAEPGPGCARSFKPWGYLGGYIGIMEKRMEASIYGLGFWFEV